MKKQTLKAFGVAFIMSMVLFTGAVVVSGSGFVVSKVERTHPSEQLWDLHLRSEESSSDILQSAYGGGTAVEFERRSTFSFNALRHSDGEVTGTLVYIFRDFDADFQVHLNLDCLIIEGNRAKLSGLITRISANFPLPPFISVGSRGSLQVEDNGTGNADLPDKYSDVHFFRATCADENDPYIPLDGNIVVIP